MAGWITIGTELETKSFDKQINELEYELKQVEYELDHKKELKLDSRTIQEYESKAEKLKNQLISLREKQIELNNTNLSKMKSSIDSVGTSVSGVIKKVGKWALAVFGIRSAYMFVRQSMSTLSQYNEQLATDVEYIRFAIATTLQPVIETIIKLVYQLLGLINSISKSLFGVDLFANASANAFKKSNKNANELKKTLAGFDEMNVLNDNGSVGAIGGLSPSIDLSQMGDTDLSNVTNLLDKIKALFDKTFDTIVGNVKKVLIDLGASPDFIKAWENTLNSIKKIFEGVIDFIIGLVEVVVGLLTGDTEMVKDGIDRAIKGIKDFILGLFDFIINIKTLTVTAIKDGFNSLANFVYEKIIKPIGQWFSNLGDSMTTSITNGVKNVNNWFNRIPEHLKNIKNKVVDVFKNMGTSIGSAVSGAFTNVINAVLSRVETTLNKPIGAINSLIDKINEIPGINLGKISTVKLPRLKKGAVANVPGKGIPTPRGDAIYAEHGTEAYLPLSDNQQMELLGASIGRHVNITATIPVYAYNRQVDRQIQKIKAEDNFAFNG